jgi:hypothetical protein
MLGKQVQAARPEPFSLMDGNRIIFLISDFVMSDLWRKTLLIVFVFLINQLTNQLVFP